MALVFCIENCSGQVCIMCNILHFFYFSLHFAGIYLKSLGKYVGKVEFILCSCKNSTFSKLGVAPIKNRHVRDYPTSGSLILQTPKFYLLRQISFNLISESTVHIMQLQQCANFGFVKFRIKCSVTTDCSTNHNAIGKQIQLEKSAGLLSFKHHNYFYFSDKFLLTS